MRGKGFTLVRVFGLVLAPWTSPQLTFALDPALPPGGNFDLAHWYLTLPDAIASQIQAERLTNGYIHPAWFYTGKDGAMVFWAPVTGGSTLNSTYPRSELREQFSPPDNNGNWTAHGTHILQGRCKVIKLPSSGKVIIGQIHGYTGNAYPLLKLTYASGKPDALVKLSPNSSSDTHYTFPNVSLGAVIDYEIKFVDGLLSMTVNGVTQSVDIFKSDPEWAKQTMYFKAGSYCQDNSGDVNEGAQVEFSHLSVYHSELAQFPTVIDKQPVSQSVDSGATVLFKVITFGTPPYTYQWLHNGTNFTYGNLNDGAVAAALTLTNVQPEQAGTYQLVVSNATGVVMSAPATLAVRRVITLAQALDTPGWLWTTNGSPWLAQTNVTYEGTSAVMSGAVKDGKTASLQTTLSGPGTVSFWWKVSSETNKDALVFTVGSKELARISGEVNWEYRSFLVGPGSQALKWTYSKNSSTAKGLDRGWLDSVSFVPLPRPGAPSGLSAAALGGDRIGLHWTDNSTNESGFILERSTDGVTFSRVATLGADVTAWISAGLFAETAYSYRVCATNLAGSSAYTEVAQAVTGPFSGARINFQPASAAVPADYVADSGQVYGDRGNGLSYGWNKSNTSNTKDRNSSRSPDQRYDTFIYSQKTSGSYWEIGLPNGLYDVLLVAGDPGDSGIVYKFNVEGLLVVNGKSTSSSRWITGTATVNIRDGRLTVSNASGASENRICFIDITRRGPLLSCPEDKEVVAASGWDFDSPVAAKDLCSGNDVTITVLSTVTNQAGFCQGTFEVTRQWLATDACGNSNTCSQTVLVKDTTPPALLCAPLRLVESGMSWAFEGPMADGSNIVVSITSTTTSNLCGNTLIATRTWSAADACGNSNTCSQIVMVVDTVPPTILCADTNTCDPNIKVLPGVVDDGDNQPELSCTRDDGQEMDAPFPVGTTVVTCAAKDCSLNTATCTFTVTVETGDPCQGANNLAPPKVSAPPGN